MRIKYIKSVLVYIPALLAQVKLDVDSALPSRVCFDRLQSLVSTYTDVGTHNLVLPLEADHDTKDSDSAAPAKNKKQTKNIRE